MNIEHTRAQRRRTVTAFLAVGISAAALLAAGTDRMPMASAYQDRFSHIGSQDEATYSRAALEIVYGGDWLTPHLLGRFFLYKPPLLYWLAGLSVKCLGLSRLALRLPNVIAGAFATAVVFAWCRYIGSWRSGLIGAILMASNSVWQTMSRLACMDVLLASCILLALFFLVRDPGLTRRSSVLGFGCASGAAILTKSVAGAIPILALLIFAMPAGAHKRPNLRRIVLTLMAAIAVAAPWHVYQLAVHRQWFVTEYIGAQLLGFGAHPPVQSHEPALWFYSSRMFATDPVLVTLFLFGIPGFALAIRRGSTRALVLGVWLGVTIAAVFAFQSRSFLYAVLFVPLLCLIAAAYSMVPRRAELYLIFLLAGLGIGKVYANAPWDLAFYRVAASQSQRNLRWFAEKGRGNELIVVQPDDEFYSMLLPIHGIRYCWIGQIEAVQRYAPHLADLGITVPAGQFIDLDQFQPRYDVLLQRWGLHSSEPIATSIMARSPGDVLLIIRSRPASDFYVPRELLDGKWDQIEATHAVDAAPGNRVFLLARQAAKTVRWTPIPSQGATL